MTDISVIIPTYNRVLLLERALESVRYQSLHPMEIIVVDDGSTDATRAMMISFMKQAEIRTVYRKQSNQGPAAARNRGIGAARGRYLAFLDSDDQWREDKLALQYGAMKSDPACLVSHTRERWLRNDRHLNQKKYHLPPSGDIFQNSLRLCCVGMSTVMVRRELFDCYGWFDEALRCCEDFDLWLRVSPFESFLLVDEALTIKHGGRSDQVSSQFRLGMDRFRIQSLAKLIHAAFIRAEQSRQAEAELARRCRIYGNGCLKHGRHDEARWYLGLAENFADSCDNAN